MRSNGHHGFGHIPGSEPSGKDHSLLGMVPNKAAGQSPINGVTAPSVGSWNSGIEKEPRGFKSGRRLNVPFRANPQSLDPVRKSGSLSSAELRRLVPVKLNGIEAEGLAESYK